MPPCPPLQLPVQRHTENELASLPHADLVRLVLDLEARIEILEQGDGVASPAAAGAATGAPGEGLRGRAGPSGLGEPAASAVGSSSAPTAAEHDAQHSWHEGICGSELPRPVPLKRAFSRVPDNVEAARKLREELATAVEGLFENTDSEDSWGDGSLLQLLTHSNFFLPALSAEREAEHPGLDKWIRSSLTTDDKVRASLEDTKVLNWAVASGDLSEKHRLHMLLTSADGNCLLHATLLAMWGLHDTHQVGNSGASSLRAAMSRLLKDARFAESLRQRWEVQVRRDDACMGNESFPKGGVEMSEEQLRRDWEEMVEIAGKPRMHLDTIHILALAHALRRPILVMANRTELDFFGEPLTPIYFSGIYLPLERDTKLCSKQPIVLSFYKNHFSPLVPAETDSAHGQPVRIPLCSGFGGALPLQFATESELANEGALIRAYLDVEVDVPMPKAGLKCSVALLQRDASHPLLRDMRQRFVANAARAFSASTSSTATSASSSRPGASTSGMIGCSGVAGAAEDIGACFGDGGGCPGEGTSRIDFKANGSGARAEEPLPFVVRPGPEPDASEGIHNEGGMKEPGAADRAAPEQSETAKRTASALPDATAGCGPPAATRDGPGGASAGTSAAGSGEQKKEPKRRKVQVPKAKAKRPSKAPPPMPPSSPRPQGNDDPNDAVVQHSFQVVLPRSLRPGDKAVYNLPKGCTVPENLEFVVPDGCYEGDMVKLSAHFKIKAHCISALRDVINCSHEKALEMLKNSLGDANAAAANYFRSGAGSG